MVKIIYPQTRYKGEIKISKQVLDYLKENNITSVSLFASVQFLELNKVKEQLKNLNIKVLTTKAKRAEFESQILGCNIYPDNFEKNIIKSSDLILYIGDGSFHPSALLFSQTNPKPVITYNPISKNMKILTIKDIEKNLKKIKANLNGFILAEKIGILVSLKPGQQNLEMALKLKKELKTKKAFIFIDNNFKFENMENFNFIDCWVNTACPRIATDDILELRKPLVNIRDIILI